MAFEETKNTTSRRDESLIPNTQIEAMFMRICTDEQMTSYVKLVDGGHVSLATAYASNLVYKVFYLLVDELELKGGKIELLNKVKKGKK